MFFLIYLMHAARLLLLMTLITFGERMVLHMSGWAEATTLDRKETGT
jgi:hypothetical protein